MADDLRQVFRSPVAVAFWWVWVLFAVANLIDIAVQGRDRLSVVAAMSLLVITGIMYVAVERPKLVADAGGLTVTNPLRDHRVGWAAVAGFDSTDLLRVRCEWPADSGAGTRKRAIYSWAVHSSRRRQVSAELRAQRLARRDRGRGRAGFGGFGGFAAEGAQSAPPPAPLGLDSDHVVSALTARAEEARLAAPDHSAAPPVSTWDLTAIAAVVLPVIALLVAVFA